MKKQYISPTYGVLTLSELRQRINAFMVDPDRIQYRIIIGTDSQQKNGGTTDFVTAIIIHRVGAGGVYFWRRWMDAKKRALKQRMFEEATYSVIAAQEFLELFSAEGIADVLSIHVDIGKNGPTRSIINEVVAMIRGSGFSVKIKPDSFGASKVADRHT